MPQGLEEAERQLEKEKTELDSLQVSQASAESSKTNQEDSDEGEEDGEEENVFKLQPDCRMASILQEALYKCEQVIALMTQR